MFLSFWETKPKYLINFLPMVVLLSVADAVYLEKLIPKNKIKAL